MRNRMRMRKRRRKRRSKRGRIRNFSFQRTVSCVTWERKTLWQLLKTVYCTKMFGVGYNFPKAKVLIIPHLLLFLILHFKYCSAQNIYQYKWTFLLQIILNYILGSFFKTIVNFLLFCYKMLNRFQGAVHIYLTKIPILQNLVNYFNSSASSIRVSNYMYTF